MELLKARKEKAQNDRKVDNFGHCVLEPWPNELLNHLGLFNQSSETLLRSGSKEFPCSKEKVP
jgi:hypothetical protein